jgi:AcrR family transcriptional regulator
MIFGSVEDLRKNLLQYIGDIDVGDAKGRKRLRIIEEATRQFVTYGYRKTVMGDVAKAAGMAKGTIYLYFETKADLFVTAVAYEKYRTMSWLQDVFEVGISGRERLRRWVRAAITMVLESPLLSRIATEVHELEPELLQRFGAVTAASRAEHERFMAELIDEAVFPAKWDPRDKHEQMVALYALIRVAPILRNEQLRLGVPLERLVETTSRIVVDGLHPRLA